MPSFVKASDKLMLLAGKVLEWEAAAAAPMGGSHVARRSYGRNEPFCASLVSRNPLRHAAPDAIFTQSSLFTQAFFRFLWESWETEAANPGHVPVFQIPSIAQPGFRKLTLCQPSLPQAFQPAFHFSALNYGYYYLFSLSLLPLSTPAGWRTPTWLRVASGAKARIDFASSCGG